MSGPKSSRYTLTPEQRRILEEQRKLERRRAKASNIINVNCTNIAKIGCNIFDEIEISNELTNYTNNDGGIKNKIREFELLKISNDNLIANLNKEDVDFLESIAKVTTNNLKKAEILNKEISNIKVQNEIVLKNYLKGDIDKGNATSFRELKIESENSINQLKDKIFEQLKTMEKENNLSTNLKNEVKDTISNLMEIDNKDFLRNYYSLTVTSLLKRCNQYISEYDKCYEEFNELFNEYTALCDLHYYVAQEYTCCFESITRLKLEIERIKNEVAEDDEQAYISECLDEVMEEMGYNVIGKREVVKKSGRRFKNELYTYGEGTAVNVTYSSDGRISMELGGIDSVDRIPSNREAEMLCASMEQFCDDFKEIEKRLLAKGVILAERISHLPSSAEYAQIINVEDYEIENNIDKLQIKKQNRNTKNIKAMMKE